MSRGIRWSPRARTQAQVQALQQAASTGSQFCNCRRSNSLPKPPLGSGGKNGHIHVEMTGLQCPSLVLCWLCCFGVSEQRLHGFCFKTFTDILQRLQGFQKIHTKQMTGSTSHELQYLTARRKWSSKNWNYCCPAANCIAIEPLR